MEFWRNILPPSSCVHRASPVSKTLFIITTDAHYYKSVEMLKQFKVITLAPTCFGSSRNHHQGAVLCSAKTTDMVFSVLFDMDSVNVMAAYRPVLEACVHCERMPTQQADMPP
jgi:hypothetical protein